MNAQKNPFRVKVKLFSGCVRVEITAMRVDIPISDKASERAQTMMIVDAMRDMSGMFAAALSLALKDCSHTIAVVGAEPESSKIIPIKLP